jgi:hypothetical protein
VGPLLLLIVIAALLVALVEQHRRAARREIVLQAWIAELSQQDDQIQKLANYAMKSLRNRGIEFETPKAKGGDKK